jgi:hypothetical protein
MGTYFVCYDINEGKLDVSNNHLTGTVPSDLGYLLTWSEYRTYEIEKMELKKYFCTTYPSCFLCYVSQEYIDLSNNMMTGSIFSPEYLDKLGKIFLVDVMRFQMHE